MKRCPKCNRVEADEALAFCRADGTPLINESSLISDEAGTVRLGSSSTEVATNILPHKTDTVVNRGTSPGISPRQSDAALTTTKSTNWKAVIAVGSPIVLIIMIGIAVYFYTKRNENRVIESVAVLPFENKSGNPDSEYLSDGLAESLIYRLSQLSNLKVSPRSSVFRYKDQTTDAEKIGNELGVDAVMSGRFVQRGDNLVISVDLIDLRNYPEALAEAQKSAELSNRSNASLALLGHLYIKLQRQGEAAAIIKELEKRYADKQADGRDLVVVYAGSDKDKAFAWLEKAFADKSVFMVFLRLEPLMESLHSDPRWQDTERRVGLIK